MPDDGSKPHRFRPELSTKLVGGKSGCCQECDRSWAATDGMPMGTGDRFTLRDKAATLVRLAQGSSYRKASEFARTRGGYARRKGGVLVASEDGRLARDWVSQYAPLLADRFVPRRWPRVLVLDKLPVHTKSREGNLPRPSGTTQFYIFAALSYVNKRSTVWRYAASRGAKQPDWLAFFRSREGAPEQVVCDGEAALMAAAHEAWPNARVYRCTAHLRENVETILTKGGLHDRRRLLMRVLTEHTFADPAAYAQFRYVAERYLKADRSRANQKASDALDRLERWLAKHEDDIARGLVENHWPVSIGAIERPLREVKNAIYDRRANIKNLDRLTDLLVLHQLQQMGHANERDIMSVLRRAHIKSGGKPPARRTHDDPSLAPPRS